MHMLMNEHVEHHSAIAQLVERLAVNELVVGSSPTRGAIQNLKRTFGQKTLVYQGFFEVRTERES